MRNVEYVLPFKSKGLIYNVCMYNAKLDPDFVSAVITNVRFFFYWIKFLQRISEDKFPIKVKDVLHIEFSIKFNLNLLPFSWIQVLFWIQPAKF